MSDKNKYSSLNICLENMCGYITHWASEAGYKKIDCNYLLKGNTHLYTIIVDSMEIKLSLVNCTGGLYSINYHVGKHQDISLKLADYLVERVSSNMVNNSPYRHGFTLAMKESDFQALFDLLKEDSDIKFEDVKDSRKETSNKIFIKIRSIRYHDSANLTYYYGTNNLFLQGKPLELFNRIIEIVSEKSGLNSIVNAELKFSNVCISENELIDEMKSALKESYAFLTIAQIAILSNAFIFNRINFEFIGSELKRDYSPLVFPAFRALEGYIFKQLISNSIIHNDENLGYFFRNEDANYPLTLYPQHASTIDNQTIESEINKAYRTYHKLRHQFSHAGESEMNTAIITTRSIADSYFEDVINVIRITHQRINEAKCNK